MSSMYSLQSFGEVHVEPAEILYKLPSYHGEEAGSSSSKISTSTKDKSAELKELVQKVVDATNRLAITMKEFANTQKKQAASTAISSGPYFQASSAKHLTFDLEEGFSHACAQFHYKVAQYKPITDKKFEVYAGPKYHHVIKVLQEIFGNRKTLMNFRDVTTDGIYVETFSSNGQNTTVKSSVASLLLIGEVLGIYSYRDYHLAGTGEWLARIDDALHGRITVDELVRESSQHLGALDLLTKSNDVSLVDIVFTAVIRHVQHLPNNVEMHVKRVNESLSDA